MVAVEVCENHGPDVVGLNPGGLGGGEGSGAAVDQQALFSALQPEARLVATAGSERIAGAEEVEAYLFIAHGRNQANVAVWDVWPSLDIPGTTPRPARYARNCSCPTGVPEPLRATIHAAGEDKEEVGEAVEVADVV